jgi:choline-sulfatase
MAPRRAHPLALALLALAACGEPTEPRQAARPERPNVLLVVIDTLRSDHLSCYGHERATSPQLDALAARSWVYDRAYAQAPWTTPSIGALLTSRYPTTLGIRSDRSVLPEDEITLAETLQADGYHTAAVVSHSFCSSRWGFAQGFQDFDESNVLGHDAVTSEGVTARGLAFLESRRDSAQPWFLWLHYFDPHCAYVEQTETFGGAGSYAGPVRSGQLYSELWKQRRDLEPEDHAELRRLYDSEIHHTDAQLGRILSHLESTGALEDTIVVVTADHGEEFGDHGSIGHARTLHEELIRVPLVVRIPGQEPQRIDDPVALVDLYPTVLSALGTEVPAGRVGQDIRPGGPGLQPGRVVYSETSRGARLRAAIQGPWKVIREGRMPQPAVYDLGRDPLEQASLPIASAPEAQDLTRALDDWWGALKDEAREEATLDLGGEEQQLLEQLGYGGE